MGAAERLNERGIPVHRSERGQLAGFIGYMPQAPAIGEIIYLGRKPYKVKGVSWVFDPNPSEWEARLELKYCGGW